MLLRQAADLQREILSLQERLNTLVRSARGVSVRLPEIHDRRTGRIDAQRTAEFLGIPLKRLAESLGLNYKAVHRNTASASIQSALQPIKRALEILQEFFPNAESARIWLNTPHPDLNGQSALNAILAGNTEAVLIILENASAGVPV
jgi:hypothetical protein